MINKKDWNEMRNKELRWRMVDLNSKLKKVQDQLGNQRMKDSNLIIEETRLELEIKKFEGIIKC